METDASLAIVPAAGRSERFGSAKLVADLAGEPLLNHTLRCLLDAGLDRVVVVATAEATLETVNLLADGRVSLVTNPDPARGMFSSIQTGLAAQSGHPVVVLPADMPFVMSETVRAVLTECARCGSVAVPVHGGRRGHPIALAGRLRDALLATDPGASLKDALAKMGVVPVELAVDDPGVLWDVDARADLGGPGSS